MQGIEAIAAAIGGAGLPYALIGGHAVNVWLEPRFTADVDLTVVAARADLARLEAALAPLGLSLSQAQGADLPSGPDVVRYATADQAIVVEIQLAKTDFQRQAVRRATIEDGVCVATREDLIVMKLIADRPKDHVDLLGLTALADLDWPYIERWAAEWGVSDRLLRLRSGRI